MNRVEKGIIRGLKEAVAFERGQQPALVRTRVQLGSDTVVIEARGFKGKPVKWIRLLPKLRRG